MVLGLSSGFARSPEKSSVQSSVPVLVVSTRKEEVGVDDILSALLSAIPDPRDRKRKRDFDAISLLPAEEGRGRPLEFRVTLRVWVEGLVSLIGLVE